MHNKQKRQELEYQIPYHHLPVCNGGFSYAPVWNFGLQYCAMLRFVIEEILIHSNGNTVDILDIGCGDGRLVREINSRIPVAECKGVDYSMKAIELAKTVVGKEYFECRNIVKEQLPNSADIVTCIEVIEHIPEDDLENFVAAMLNHLRPGGTLILTTPSINRRVSKKHFQHFDKKNIEKLFGRYVDVNKLEYFNTPTRSWGYLRRLMVNDYFILRHEKMMRYLFNFYYDNVFLNATNSGHRLVLVAKKSASLSNNT